ncbi:biotin--[acetyl-CoA-carboxylase] ligase [Rhodococcus rhodnii]|uniref:biotin--[biotin carboxyl-carrier protein] ligase n=2 Tax=Rhodococcus rhodnii TaxID=38312 RepID=R7WJE3_9NOCA|nr:biotin--[acetyl-CoA-carboxylase] ligase [Rhodococcus rhodnii]EOM75402.1 biotin--[acetyl-CoA-carboxylase] ligase [Rhodococcus rhodnii LMG 5362]TXG90562.1 biotin--[acetyl-CoA-carboxylase] ligase [Rhodococcus rhodnii]
MSTIPDRPPLDESALRGALLSPDDPATFWRGLDVVADTGSTNTDLLARARAGDADRRLLLAEYQSGARGRHARSWVGPPRAQLVVSAVVTLPDASLAAAGWLPLVTGLAVVDAVREVAGVAADLKWPNDVMVAGRKLAGILAEVAVAAPDPVVVVGVGLNVSTTRDELPVDTATSLHLEGATAVDRGELAVAFARALGERLTRWLGANWDPADLASDYRERCSTLGRRVRAELPGDRVEIGIARDIDADGRLVVERDGGQEPLVVAAGDITHLRPIGDDGAPRGD